jgi:hypothetical protein
MNTSPIRGLKELSLKKANVSVNLKICWSSTTSFEETNSQTFGVDSNLAVTCNFNDSMPSFIKVVAMGDSDSSIDEGSLFFGSHNATVSLSLAPIPAEGGSVLGSGVYSVGSNVTISATPNAGYSFSGWYSNGALASSANPYSFALESNDVSYEARFTNGGHNYLSLSSKEIATNPVGFCLVHGAGYHLDGSEATISVDVQNGYGFLGWYDNDSLVSMDNPYTFVMPSKDVSYLARFSKKNHVSVTSKDESKGTVSGAGDFAYTSSVTVIGTPTVANPFNAITWYDDSFAAVSTNLSYTFAMPESDINLSADFHKALGSSFYLGRYPQTMVEDSATLTALASATDTDSDGYLEYGSDEYKKATGAPYRSGSYKSISGNVTFATNTTYYFKVEPIQWRILSGKGTATGLVMSEKILTTNVYCPADGSGSWYLRRTIAGSTVYGNNYLYSTPRTRLNGYDGSSYWAGNFTGKGFFDLVFTEEEKSFNTVTTVGNSAVTTGSSYNFYDCPDTNDRMFLLSRQDLTNESYGFSLSSSNSDVARCGVLTDYARATGAMMSTDSSHYGNGSWWSRSPYSDNEELTYIVNMDGSISSVTVYFEGFGIRPCFTVNIG